jgi:hypothetical protein
MTDMNHDTWTQRWPWLTGCNFIPSTAINQLEMWQADTFDPETIDRELSMAESIGLNVVRVYLHDLLWSQDSSGLVHRMRQFLDIAQEHGIAALFVLFDDCWNDGAQLGKQPDPVPGVHNSGWLQSPGARVVNDPSNWAPLEKYAKEVLSTFADEPRIVGWDLYNEPGAGGQGSRSIPLLRKAFSWARQAASSQPLTSGVWTEGEVTAVQVELSDIVTFHNYRDVASLKAQIEELRQHGRPLLCTEWLNRHQGSTVQTCLPAFFESGVGCIHWGLVSGKTNTIFPWGSKPGAPEPSVWFHDLFRKDGTAFDPEETALFREYRQKA